ncbi:MAG: multidrug transporter ATP-binding protein [Symbiobacteriaceae bacterium]|jgi:ATP-binding cassette subfamily B protein|nr:multidrug transporter ATP-binding protein [Symbiobacteriaceae bacterium]
MMKLIKYLKPYWLPITAILVLAFFQSLSELYLPTLMSDIVDKGIMAGDTDYIWRVGGQMLLVALAGTAGAIISSYLSAKVASGYGKDLRRKVFTRVSSFSLHEFDKIGTATLITRTTNDITQVQQVWVMILRMMISAPMMSIGGIVMAVSKDAKLSLIIVVVIPVLLGVIGFLAAKGIPLFKVIQEKVDRLNLVVREGLTGIRVIRAFNRTAYEKVKFQGANRELTDTAIRVNIIMATMMPAMMLIMNFTSIAIIWFGGIRIDAGHMQVGDLMAFIQYVMQIMFSFVMVSMMFIMIPRASASAVRINDVLETVPEINDPDVATSTGSQKGYVEFRDVTFSYPGAEAPAISNISFAARPGEVTAIIGGTGSGKSTLVNLIPRFYDVDSGNVLVDGVDVRELTQEQLRAKIGLVPQKALLFSGSIAANIRYGKEGATDEEIRKAAEIAQATEFISEMKDGFDSEIAQGGTNVSGGQKQRLTIARALVRRPEIYLFDDNFSALDFKTDARLRAALRKETADATVIIVAQRVSTVMDANRIIVLDDGQIAGIGTHKELLKNCDVYREIVSSQLAEEELA